NSFLKYQAPAALTKPCSWWWCCLNFLASSFTDSIRLKSAVRKETWLLPVFSEISFTACSPLPALRLTTTTFSPVCAMPVAMAFPTPDVPPVTKYVFIFSEVIFFGCLFYMLLYIFQQTDMY